MPLLWVLVIPFALQLAGSVGIVAYITSRSAQNDLENVAERLREQAASRIREALDQRLQEQQQTLTVTYEALHRDPRWKENPARLQQVLWQKMQFSPTLNSLYWADKQGMELGYGRLNTPDVLNQVEQLTGRPLSLGTPYIVERSPLQLRERLFYLVDLQGKPQQRVYSMALPVEQLSWYQAAQSLHRQGWSPIFATHVTAQMSLNALLPVRDGDGNFQGVLTTFLALADISEFLDRLAFSPTGEAFILERSGALVASSHQNTRPYRQHPIGRLERIYAQDSDHPWLRAIAEHLLQDNDSFDHVQSHDHLDLTVNGEVLHVDIQTYQDSYGLDWILVVVLPYSDLMPSIQASQRSMLWLLGLTLTAVTGISWLTAQLIMAPLRRLGQASQALATGEQPPLTEPTAIAEFAHLAHTFNRMAQITQTTQAETQRLKDRLEFILAASPAAIFTCGLDYTITFISQNIAGMVGYTAEEIIGWNGFWAEHIHPDDAERVHGELAMFFEVGHSTHEYRWKHRDGRYRWMFNELSLVQDAQGQTQEIVGYCIEVSDRKQAEAKLQQTNADLLRATRLKDEFLAAMSHELRTPLTAILGMTEGLQEGIFGPMSPEQTKALTLVDRSGTHLLQLINDILDVSKLESGQMTLHPG